MRAYCGKADSDWNLRNIGRSVHHQGSALSPLSNHAGGCRSFTPRFEGRDARSPWFLLRWSCFVWAITASGI